MQTTIIGSGDRLIDWLDSPPGRYLLAWEQAQFDAAVADVFGFFALQCGLPRIDCLRMNRMRSRIHARFLDDVADTGGTDDSTVDTVRVAHFEELPFATQSLDMVVLPHVLEFAHDPHQVLREVDRVLRPEGRLYVSGLNPVSLWGARQVIAHGIVPPFLPREGQFIAVQRLRDWVKLLGFDLERTRYGCYRPPCRSEVWLERTAFMERAGDRWWPICGAAYFVAAVKRVRGMRLIAPAWTTRASARRQAAAAPLSVAERGVTVNVSEAARARTCSAATEAAD
jgi:SAM-dependent methyltransferase